MHVVMAGDYPADPNRISGGVEAVVLHLTRALQRHPDLKLDIVTLDRRGTARRTVRHDNVTVHYLPTSLLPSYLSTLANIRQIRAELIRLKPDLIHVQVAGEFAEAAAGAGLPWVLTLHGIRFLEVALWEGFLNKIYRGWFIKRLERRAIKQARYIISISPFIHSTFNGQIRGNIYDIENPIDDAFFKVPQNRKPGQLLFVGRLIPRKGVHILLRAFADLHRQMPEVTLRLAGGDASPNESKTYPQELKQFVVDAGLEEAVTFLGALDGPALLEEYSSCSALVLSSVLETAPMVIMEAMAASKAVVSTDAGGARYLVEHGRTGLIVPPNDEQVLCEALYQVLSDEARLETMGRRAREVATQRFHTRAVAARTREVYYNILGQSPLQ
jgi:glycosyltransferase involved in cell wall biosynthesis